MEDGKIHAGIRFNKPVAKYVKFEYDLATDELHVYITGMVEGSEITIMGTISQWVPVVQEG